MYTIDFLIRKKILLMLKRILDFNLYRKKIN